MYNYTSTGFIDSCIEHYFSSAKVKKRFPTHNTVNIIWVHITFWCLSNTKTRILRQHNLLIQDVRAVKSRYIQSNK